MEPSLDELLDATIALAYGISDPRKITADEFADGRRHTADLAIAHGFPPARADEIAGEIQRTLTAFAVALRGAAEAAEEVLKYSDMLTEEMLNNARTD